ncbi:hypothetical protein AQUCO_00100251v1 [Aquilegia coerulea]|uniref:Initiator tRNA phosphoribosyl transferase family protein n=1 Tax=Aquilegia coerulea TaxID=218851 RepID=A0A2G5F9N4_AQUCA|nr:hypothetical protein AQUCO_00100251v1 [Aquilegia coerulea]
MAEERLNIYKVARTIKRKDNSLYNALRSIYQDSIFIGEISQLWPNLPLLANLRCGLWYFSHFESTCYFKSTDGHCNNWSFNTSRLNLHVAQLAGQKGGCMIVDSTRKGKRFPDSMSKTIPIWTCVLNRAIANYKKKMQIDGVEKEFMDSDIVNCDSHNSNKVSDDWDCSLHLPLWVSKSEMQSIEDRLDDWTKELEMSGADIASLASSLQKPLRPLWISQKSVIWLNEVPDYDSWDFTPIILVTASDSVGIVQQRASAEFSWHYISGAGDDEESWARGLTPTLFWKHSYDLINFGPDLCNQKVADIVEKDRVYRAQRGQNAPQFNIRSQMLVAGSHLSNEDKGLDSSILYKNIKVEDMDENNPVSWLGSTSLALGSIQLVANCCNEIDCLLNCDSESTSICLPDADAYLHLPIVTSKYDRFSLLSNLPSALKFAKLNLRRGKTLLVCCRTGEDISVCICLAILASLFDDGGSFDDGDSFKQTCINKWEMRKRLVFICKFATKARPSRGNLRQVFNFLNRDTVHSVS